MNEKELKIIQKLIEVEKTIGDLYKVYSEKFPEYSQFWKETSNEEAVHAGFLITLGSQMNDKTEYFDAKGFNLAALDTMINYIKEKIRTAGDGNESALSALSIALDIERSLIESKFYESFRGESHELKTTIEKIIADTKRHREQIQALRDKQKNK